MSSTLPQAVDPQDATMAKQGFGESQIQLAGETAASAVEAHARAAVQSRYIMAMQRPRNMDQVRQDLLKECLRPGFAEAAIYELPFGDRITGPSIRFAEAALRCMKNIYVENPAIYDDAKKRILKVSVTDLEANLYYSKDITIDKTVERNSVRQGQTVLSTRQGSSGRTVYVVTASDDELIKKENAQISKAIRTMGLRLIPGDLLDECMALLWKTRASETATDPDASKKSVLDGFFKLNVTPQMIERYLGHEVATMSPAEIDSLRGLWAAIRDGDITWATVMDRRETGAKSPKTDAESPPAKKKGGVEGLKQERKKQRSETDKEPDPDQGDMFGNTDADLEDRTSLINRIFEAGKALGAKKESELTGLAGDHVSAQVDNLQQLTTKRLETFLGSLEQSAKGE